MKIAVVTAGYPSRTDYASAFVHARTKMYKKLARRCTCSPCATESDPASIRSRESR